MASRAPADGTSSSNLVTALYSRTKTLHIEAEKSGVIRELLRGLASRQSYVLYLRNLAPAYQALENGIERHRSDPEFAALAGYRFDRALAVESDLTALHGANWAHDVPLLPAAECYAQSIADAAEGDGLRLIAHAYTRYLGDLSGGQILRRLLVKSLGLQARELSFYDFPPQYDPAVLKDDYRSALNQAGALAADREAIIEEAAIAFSHNIELSWAVQAAVADRAAP